MLRLLIHRFLVFLHVVMVFRMGMSQVLIVVVHVVFVFQVLILFVVISFVILMRIL